jgi:hypothetical protein
MNTKKERLNRVVARGETNGHSHIITGECTLTRTGNKIIIKAGKNCAIKHLLEQPFVEEGLEIWTKEHLDIQIQEGSEMKIIQQQEYNPYEESIRRVRD